MQLINVSQEAIEDLNKKRIECFIVTEQAILNNPETFQEIKRVLIRITYEPVDIDTYFGTACRLARLLKEMGPETIFTRYFHENIDPSLNGKAYFFRAECQSLLEQIDDLNNWRKSRRKLVLI